MNNFHRHFKPFSSSKHNSIKAKSYSSNDPLENVALQKITNKYSTSQVYFHIQTIDRIFSQKRKYQQSITVKDLGFDQEEEFLDKLFSESEAQDQLPELFEYYKYYTQQPVCFLKNEFDIMFEYQEKKKAYLYNKLKKVLELSDTGKSLSLEKDKKQLDPCLIGNMLNSLNLSRKSQASHSEYKQISLPGSSRDQSYFFTQISQKLNKHFGPSRLNTIEKLDRNFKFLTHNISLHRPKKSLDMGRSPALKTMLESTNISTKQAFNKKSNRGVQRGHRRYGSTQVYTSPLPDKKGKAKRGSSTESRLFCSRNSAKDFIKTKKIKKVKKDLKLEDSKFKETSNETELNVKMNIEEIKRKINRQKVQIRQALFTATPKPLRNKKKH